MVYAPHGPEEPGSRADRWILGIFFVGILGLLTAEVAVDFHPAKLSALFFLLAWAPLLALHEAGHALMTRLVGWRVRRVVIGFGRPIWRFSLRGVPVQVRLIALEGYTQLRPLSARRAGLKHFLIYAAGPGIEALALLVIVLLVGPERLLTRTEQIDIIAAQAVSVAILAGLLTNLIPHSSPGDRGESPNDGLGMLLSLGLRDEQVEERLAQSEDDEKDGEG